MLENSLSNTVENVNNFNTDSATAYRKFCKKHKIKLNTVPSGKHSDGNINISKMSVSRMYFLIGYFKIFKCQELLKILF